MEIVGINNVGIGWGLLDGKKIFVDKTAIGDIIDNNVIVKKSKDRQEILCPYYEKCGGCNLLHLKDEVYYDFKKRLCGSDVVKTGYGMRRRVVLNEKNGKLGFFQKNTNELVEIDNCLMLSPEINAIISKVKTFKMKVAITQYDNGLGILLIGKQPESEKLNKFLGENGNIIILSCNSSLYLQRINPIVEFDDVKVEVDGNVFLQATKLGQNAIIDLVTKNLKNCKNVLDLYCGVGTYTFPLSKHANVSCYEGAEQMINLLKKNIGDRNIKAKTRDLVNQPLLVEELNKFDGIVINPPRNGAGEQCKYLARSNIKNVVMVSCNPKTFFEDIEVLKNGGYIMEESKGIDQFYGTNHLEVVGVFKR
ncbi:MAG: methyltransferase [Rickettsiales bacterium]|jgi:23S rRNA (uracil1939-C5)-methyltransferase|nr:methyltransferase [Rickettsiales bacterium]